MTDISKIFFQQAGLKASPFSPTSRYYSIEIATIESQNGEPVAYVKRRIIPSAENYFQLQKYMVTEGDRLDLLAYKFYNDAERFWQIADANVEGDPDELTKTPGKLITITLPNGIPGNSNA